MYLAYLRLHKSKPNRSGRISPISSRQPKVFSRHRAAPDKPQWPRTLVVRFHCSMYHRIHCCNQGLEEFPVFRVWCDVIWCDLVLRHSFLRFILLPLWQPQWLLESHKACQLHESRRYIYSWRCKQNLVKTDRELLWIKNYSMRMWCVSTAINNYVQIGTPNMMRLHSTSLNQFSIRCSTKNMRRH